ncbi:hypothetical protein L198_03103 [Cryptococcus wingfieldii CBS 7118]|uniref:Uncharacterized protein n=1 Tax=Cryptococcus wingfieldii CBS 7118 TaxID=1295528 RepID=A0A1E3JJG2_9TREE|nr:hypothetical protein L198_03103 [Cryptococcus wingfieldii CBS 7118]ODO00776.1 hypothetical protein L198_03103 [Cryptococcus wingfieldii CBS 7118]
MIRYAAAHRTLPESSALAVSHSLNGANTNDKSSGDIPAALVIVGRDLDTTFPTQSPFTSPAPTGSTGSNGLTHTGTIALACVLAIASIISLTFVVWWFLRRKTRKGSMSEEDVESLSPIYAPIVPEVTLFLVPPQMPESRVGRDSPGQDSEGPGQLSPAACGRRGVSPGLPTPPKAVTPGSAITVTRRSYGRAQAHLEPVTEPPETVRATEMPFQPESITKPDFLPSSVTSRLSTIGMPHSPVHKVPFARGFGRIISFDFDSPPVPERVAIRRAPIPSRASSTSRVIRQSSESSSHSVEPIRQISSGKKPYRPTAKRTRRAARNVAKSRPTSRASPHRGKSESVVGGAVQLDLLGASLPNVATPECLDRPPAAVRPLSAPQTVDHAVESSAPEDSGSNTDTDLNYTISSATSVDMPVPSIPRYPYDSQKRERGEDVVELVEVVLTDDESATLEAATPLLEQEDLSAPPPSTDDHDDGEGVVTPVIQDLFMEDDALGLQMLLSPDHIQSAHADALFGPETCVQLQSTFRPVDAVGGLDFSFQQAEGDLLDLLNDMANKSSSRIFTRGSVASTSFSSCQEPLSRMSGDSSLYVAQEKAENDLINLLETIGQPRLPSTRSNMSAAIVSHRAQSSFDAAEESLLYCLEDMCDKVVKSKDNDATEFLPATFAEAEADLLSMLVAMDPSSFALVTQDIMQIPRSGSTGSVPIGVHTPMRGQESLPIEQHRSSVNGKISTASLSRVSDIASAPEQPNIVLGGKQVVGNDTSLTEDFLDIGMELLEDQSEPIPEPSALTSVASPSIAAERRLEQPDLLASARAFLESKRTHHVHVHSKSVGNLSRETSAEDAANVRGDIWQTTPKSSNVLRSPASCYLTITRPSPASLLDKTIRSSQSTPEKQAGEKEVFFASEIGELFGAHGGGQGNLRYRQLHGDVFDELNGGMGNLFGDHESWMGHDQLDYDSDSEIF